MRWNGLRKRSAFDSRFGEFVSFTIFPFIPEIPQNLTKSIIDNEEEYDNLVPKLPNNDVTKSNRFRENDDSDRRKHFKQSRSHTKSTETKGFHRNGGESPYDNIYGTNGNLLQNGLIIVHLRCIWKSFYDWFLR